MKGKDLTILVSDLEFELCECPNKDAPVVICEANPSGNWDNTGLEVVEASYSMCGIFYVQVAGLEKLTENIGAQLFYYVAPRRIDGTQPGLHKAMHDKMYMLYAEAEEDRLEYTRRLAPAQFGVFAATVNWLGEVTQEIG